MFSDLKDLVVDLFMSAVAFIIVSVIVFICIGLIKIVCNAILGYFAISGIDFIESSIIFTLLVLFVLKRFFD